MGPLETIETALQAYLDKDRAAMEALLSDVYSFTSPLDNAIDRETYFRICWPNSAGMTGFEIVHGTQDGDFAWVIYVGSAGEKRFRNCELHRVVDGKMISTEVYFGWNVPHPNPVGKHIDTDDAPA